VWHDEHSKYSTKELKTYTAGTINSKRTPSESFSDNANASLEMNFVIDEHTALFIRAQIANKWIKL